LAHNVVIALAHFCAQSNMYFPIVKVDCLKQTKNCSTFAFISFGSNHFVDNGSQLFNLAFDNVALEIIF